MIGPAFALSAAFFWALAVILFKQSQQVFSPVTLNIYQNLVAMTLIMMTMFVLNIPFFPTKPPSFWVLLSLSGLLGITLADLFFFIALDKLGASLMAVVECLYLPSVIMLSCFMLDEQLGFGSMIGSIFVILAVGIGSLSKKNLKGEKEKKKRKKISKETLAGLGAGVLAMLFLSFSIIIIKDILEESNLLWVTLVQVGSGNLFLGIIVLCHPKKRQYMKELRISRGWITALPASVSGNFIALLCWIGGMKYTSASKAATLDQMSTVFIFLMAALFLKEKINMPRAIAMVLAVTGACFTILY